MFILGLVCISPELNSSFDSEAILNFIIILRFRIMDKLKIKISLRDGMEFSSLSEVVMG